MRVKHVLLTLAAAAAASLASAAMGETVTATLTGVDPWPGARITINGTATTPTWVNSGVGQLQWSNANWSPDPGKSSFWTYCIQAGPDNSIGLTAQTFTVVPALQSIADVSLSDAANKAAKISLMFGVAKSTLAPADAGDLTKLSNAYKSGLQLAIWEVIYDGIPTAPVSMSAFTTGNFKIDHGYYSGWWNLPASTTGSAIENAAVYLMNTTTDIDPVALQGLRDDVKPWQNQAIVFGAYSPPVPPTAVPLPASATTGIALLALNALWYWKRRRN